MSFEAGFIEEIEKTGKFGQSLGLYGRLIFAPRKHIKETAELGRLVKEMQIERSPKKWVKKLPEFWKERMIRGAGEKAKSQATGQVLKAYGGTVLGLGATGLGAKVITERRKRHVY